MSTERRTQDWSWRVKFTRWSWFNVFPVLHPSSTQSSTDLPWTGVPHEVLQLDYFVPGSSSRLEHERYRGKKQFAAMLNVTDDITMTYFRRVVQDMQVKVRLNHKPGYKFDNMSNVQHCLIGPLDVRSLHQDFCRKASREASTKAKDRVTKSKDLFFPMLFNQHSRQIYVCG